MVWFVGTTKGQQELFAAGQLREQGFRVLVPRRYTRVDNGRKPFATVDIRFKRYVFIGCEPHEVGPIRSTRGMESPPGGGSALVGGLQPFQLRPRYLLELERLVDKELEDALAAKPEARNDLVPGDEVEIDKPDDAFHGKQGVYFDSQRGVATIFLGNMEKKIEERFLKRVEAERKAA